MQTPTRRTVRNGAVGAVIGVLLGLVPIVVLVAPLIGGGIAGYLERSGPRAGAVAGAIAGALMAVLSTVVTGTILLLRFGDLPFDGLGIPLGGLLVGAFLSLIATVAQIAVGAVGGGLGGLLEVDRRRAGETATTESIDDIGGGRRLVPIAVSLLVGVVAFLAVGIALTVVLDPVIWLSVVVGLPAGVVAGTATAVLVYHMLSRPAEERVGWRTVGAGAVVVVLAFGLVLAGLSLLGEQRIDASSSNTYEYRVGISADGTLEDATFYVPVPVEGNSSRLGEEFVRTVEYSRYTPPVRGYDGEPAPVNFTYEMVDTAEGPMLSITADRIEVERVYYRNVEQGDTGYYERISPEEYDPGNPEMGVQNDGSFEFTVTLGANRTIDTATPIGDEPLFPARYNRTEVGCFGRDSETERCYEYDGRLYADYEAAEDTTVYVSAEVSGRNEWFAGGWRGNEYYEWSRVQATGAQSGWLRTDGELTVGRGVYRD